MAVDLSGDYQETKKIEVVKTHKYWIESTQGKYLDLLMGNSAFIYGFDNEIILDAVAQTQKTVGWISGKKNETCKQNDELIERICKIGNFEGLSWAVSGTDGVEAAIILNNEYWKEVNPKKKITISFSPAYHGTTLLCRALRGDGELPEHVKVFDLKIWRNIDDRHTREEPALIELRKYLEANHESVGAIFMEACPFLGGLLPWSKHWWHSIRELCDEFNLNFIVDDVAGSFGKTGHVFSQQRYGVQTDISVLGKALTNGMCPLSAACAVKRIVDIVYPAWGSGHTWQPPMAGIGAALTVLDMFDEKQIAKVEKQLAEIGQRLKDKNLVKYYHGVGLFFSLTTHGKITNNDVFFKHGLNNRLPLFDDFIGIVAPAIADEEYYLELESRLTNTLQEINQLSSQGQ